MSDYNRFCWEMSKRGASENYCDNRISEFKELVVKSYRDGLFPSSFNKEEILEDFYIGFIRGKTSKQILDEHIEFLNLAQELTLFLEENNYGILVE